VLTQRGEAYSSFFQELIDDLREKHQFTDARFSQPRNFCHFASGEEGVWYDAFFARGGRVVASVLIRRDWEETRRLFDWLEQDRAKADSEFDSRLHWSKPNDVRACTISIDRNGSIEDDAATLKDIHEWLTANLLKLKRVFGPRLRSFNDA
jgi:hypothetical protein